jgi:hypothetical protein
MMATRKLRVVSNENDEEELSPTAGGFGPRENVREMALKKLASSGLTLEEAKHYGISYQSEQSTRRNHPWAWPKTPMPALVLEYFDVDGKPIQFSRLRALREPPAQLPLVGEKKDKKKFPKYIQAPGSAVHPYFPNGRDWRAIMKVTSQLLIFVEGELKAAKGDKEGFNVIGLGGVDSFASKKKGISFLAELDAFDYTDRPCIIIYDTDLDKTEEERSGVEVARQRLANQLIARGAKVAYADLPYVGAGDKIGLDDFLVHRGREALEALIANATPMINPTAEVLREFNARYMVVKEGGKAWVMSEQQSPATGRRFLDRMKVADFKTLYMNDLVQTGVLGSSSPLLETKADIWLKHPDRRQYRHGVVVDPSTTKSRDGVLNLWRGFAFEPKAGNWELMKAHMLNVVCSGEPTHFNYLMGWLATAVQHPDGRAGVALVMRGEEGVGKGLVGNAMVRIFGQHGLAISNARHLVGNFNRHLRDCVLLFADEAFYAGDKQHVGVLKALITEPELFIEGKGDNGEPAPNYLHPMFASNSDWVVPASRTARRFFVLNVPNTKMGNFPYFKKIMKQMEAGGYAAMLHDLQNYDLTNFDIRAIPNTVGLQQQKELSLPAEARWLQEVLYRGYVGHSGETWERIPKSEKLYAHYVTFAREAKEYQALSANIFGSKMKEMGFRPTRTGPKAAQYHGYTLGALADARAQFDKIQGVKIGWPAELTAPKSEIAGFEPGNPGEPGYQTRR